MSTRRAVSLTSLLLSVAALAGCAGGSPPSPADKTPPTTLTGNWSLAGTRTPLVQPLLSTTLFVNGTSVSGSIVLQLQCAADIQLGLEAPVTGAINNDGSFQVSLGVNPGFDAGSTLTISGNSPSAPSQPWTGAYTATIVFNSPVGPASACTTTQSGTFTAAPIPPFTGTWSGAVETPALPGSGLTQGANISLHVTQDPPAPGPNGNSFGFPLSATVAITGSPCFTSGSTNGDTEGNNIVGDQFLLNLLMNDGSTLLINGNLNTLSETSLTTFLVVRGGACNNDGAILQLTTN